MSGFQIDPYCVERSQRAYTSLHIHFGDFPVLAFALNRLAHDQLCRFFVFVKFLVAFDVVIEVDDVFHCLRRLNRVARQEPPATNQPLSTIPLRALVSRASSTGAWPFQLEARRCPCRKFRKLQCPLKFRQLSPSAMSTRGQALRAIFGAELRRLWHRPLRASRNQG